MLLFSIAVAVIVDVVVVVLDVFVAVVDDSVAGFLFSTAVWLSLRCWLWCWQPCCKIAIPPTRVQLVWITFSSGNWPLTIVLL